ncbi:MAG: DUF1844 domain-containing protein [Deltaproteobacteria bacterium]|nr:DUF1844 domain-containing protein [Deltaproteobacteria bacterium]
MAEGGEKGAEKGFRVQDRRRFVPETGESREGKPQEVAAQATGTQEPGGDETGGKEEAAGEDLPEISFSTFVIGLSTQALMHLGEIPNPLSGKVESALSVAKQMIDIIGILREKTRGNLDQGEKKLIDDVLYDLRMRYVEAVKRK